MEIFDDRVDIVSSGDICKGIIPNNYDTVNIICNSIIANILNCIDYDLEQMDTRI